MSTPKTATTDNQLVALEEKLPALKEAYEQASIAFQVIFENRSKKQDRLAAFRAMQKAGTELFNTHDHVIAVGGRVGADKDPAWYTYRADTALNLMRTIVQHHRALRHAAADCGVAPESLRPSDTAFASLQYIVAAKHPGRVKDYRDQFVAAGLPTHGFDDYEVAKATSPKLETRHYVIGCVCLAVAIIFAGWTFVIRDLSNDQRNVLSAFMAIATAFGAWSFSGAISISAKHPVATAALSATGGFAIWVLAHFAPHIPHMLGVKEPPPIVAPAKSTDKE